MKTANMIQMLRCTGHKQECSSCFAKKDCDKICKDPMSWPKILVERFEQLLTNLRSTKEQNAKLASEVAFWKRRYESLLKDVSKVVHERELLDHLNK